MSHRKSLKDLASLERPWVTENLWKIWKTYQTFVWQNNSEQTNCMIEKYFLAFTINVLLCSRHIMFHIILHIIFPSNTLFSDFVFSENQSNCILFYYLRISILCILIFQQTTEVLGNLTDFFFHFCYCILRQS